MSYDGYKFEVNLANPANYFIEGLSGTADVSEESLLRYAEYIRSVMAVREDKSCFITIYGGDPLKHLDKLTAFLASVADLIDDVRISTPALDIHNQQAALMELWRKLGQKLHIEVQYPFDDVDEFVDAGAYGTFWYNLYWLLARRLGSEVNIRVSARTISRLPGVFMALVALVERTQVPSPDVKVAVSLNADEYQMFDAAVAEAAVAEFKSYVDMKRNVVPHVSFKDPMTWTTSSRPDTLMGNCMAVLCAEGTLFPGYEVPAMTNFGLSVFPMGRISDDFAVLAERYALLVSELPESLPEMSECDALFRSVPWVDEDKNDADEYNAPAVAEACELRDILREVFSEA